MTIRAVFRVQCDGPCKGWLSLPNDHAPGADVRHEDLTTEPTAILAANWPGERAARIAAQNAGWDVLRTGPVTLLCPACTENPLGIRLPALPDPDTECVCTHPFHAHNFHGLCVKVPGVIGCGCLGFQKREGSGW